MARGKRRPVLAYLTGTLGMTGAAARELLKATRTARAEAGPGALADYPVPGGDAHLLIGYAPGSRAYRFKLTAPEPDPAPGNLPGAAEPSRGRETPDGTPAGDAGNVPAPGLPASPGGAAGTEPAKITVTIWHNMAFDGQGRHTAMLDGYQPGDPVVRVFAYQADPGRPAEEIAEEAFAIFNDHPRDPGGADLACAYYGRRLRSLSFPGNSPCCSRSCCFRRRAVWPRSSSRLPASGRPASVSQVRGGRTNDGQDLAAAGAAARPA